MLQGRLNGEVIKTCASGVAGSDEFIHNKTMSLNTHPSDALHQTRVLTVGENPAEFIDILFNYGSINLTSKHFVNNMKEGQLLHKIYNKVITLRDSIERIAINTLLTENGSPVPDGFVLYDQNDDNDDDTIDPIL